MTEFDSFANNVPLESPIQATETTPLSTWREIIAQGKTDFRAASGATKLAIAATMGMYAYEIGPGGNETVAPIVLGEVSKHTQSVFPGSLIVGLATAAFIGAEQYFGGKLTMKSTRAFPAMSRSAFDILNSKSGEEKEQTYASFTDLPNGKKLAYSLAGGTSFNVTREVFAVGTTDRKKLNKVNRASLHITSASIGVLAGSIDATDKATDNVVVNTVADIIKNPLVWIAGLSAKFGVDYIKSRRQKK